MKKILPNALKAIVGISLAIGIIFIINSAFTKITHTLFPEYDTEMMGSLPEHLHHTCSGTSVLGGTCSGTCRDGCDCTCDSGWTSCTCRCSGGGNCGGGNQTNIDLLHPQFEIITVNPIQYENWKAIHGILVADNSPNAEASSKEWINIYNMLKEKKPLDVVAISKQIETLLKSQSQEVRNKVNELMIKNNSNLRV
ncbi:MAG: hypothetical protein ACK4TA_11490 [Saprospiraceae bacterium]